MGYSMSTNPRKGYTTVSMSEKAHEELKEMCEELNWPQRRVVSAALTRFRGSLRYTKLVGLAADMKELEEGE